MISATEIILIAIGVMIAILGFILPSGKRDGSVDPEELEEMVQDKLDRSLNESVRRTIEGMAKDAVDEAIDDDKLELSRISNEKVMEISEYAGTVLEDIKKNHDEVVFMYDMLNDKHKNLTNAVTEMTRTAESAKQTLRDAELTAQDARDAAATLDLLTAKARVTAREHRNPPAPEPAETRYTAESEHPVIVTAEAPAEVRTAPEPQTSHVQNIREVTPAPAPVPAPAPAPAPEVPVRSADPDFNGSVFRPDPAETPAPAPSETPVSVQTPAQEEKPQEIPAVQTLRPVSPRPEIEPMPKNKQILEMHKAGKSNMVIARELGLGIGEVRLVIDLSRKQMRTG